MKMNSNLFPVARYGFKRIAYALAFMLLFLILGFDTLAFIAFLYLIVKKIVKLLSCEIVNCVVFVYYLSLGVVLKLKHGRKGRL